MKTILSTHRVRIALVVTLLLTSAVDRGLLAADPSVKAKPTTKTASHSSSNDKLYFNSIDGQPIRLTSGQ